jgi:hypothetical protein
VIDRLSADLRREFPEHRGFSPRNLKYMRAFATAWAEREFVQGPFAQITWYQHLALLDKLSTPEHRLWSAGKAVENGWSRDVLALQIAAGLHERQGKAVTNFSKTLPPPQSGLAQQITKDPYLFVAVQLSRPRYTRTQLAGVVRVISEWGQHYTLYI